MRPSGKSSTCQPPSWNNTSPSRPTLRPRSRPTPGQRVDSSNRRFMPTTFVATALTGMRRPATMSLGGSIFLLVVGAVLTFAVDVSSSSGFNLNTVGIILMAAGALGVVLSLLFWSSFSPYRRGGTVVGGDTVVEERHVRRDIP